MKLFASICGAAALFTGAITFQILRKFDAMYTGLGVELPAYARWMLWGKGALPAGLLVASAVVVVIGLATRRNKWMLAGGLSGIALMAAAATIVPASIMIPLAKVLSQDGPRGVRRETVAVFPPSVDPSKVGTHPARTASGGGYFYDEVLEYRVWIHPEKGGQDLHGGEHYFQAFATHEEAERFSKETPGAARPMVLVRQSEWIAEPERGKFEPAKGERVAEWRIEWLANGKREPGSIAGFLRGNAGAEPGPE